MEKELNIPEEVKNLMNNVMELLNFIMNCMLDPEGKTKEEMLSQAYEIAINALKDTNAQNLVFKTTSLIECIATDIVNPEGKTDDEITAEAFDTAITILENCRENNFIEVDK